MKKKQKVQLKWKTGERNLKAALAGRRTRISDLADRTINIIKSEKRL